MPTDDRRTAPAGSVAARRIIAHDGILGEEMAICAGTGSAPFEISGSLWQAIAARVEGESSERNAIGLEKTPERMTEVTGTPRGIDRSL